MSKKNKTEKWKYWLIEDGSVDVDDLQQFIFENNLKIKIVVYRQGAAKPELKSIKGVWGMKDIRLEVSPRVYNILLEFMKSLNIKSFGVKSKHVDGKQILTIYTNRPGSIIGKNGSTLQQLLNKIHEDILDRDINIAIEEVDFFIRDDNEPYTDEEFVDEFNKYMLARGF